MIIAITVILLIAALAIDRHVKARRVREWAEFFKRLDDIVLKRIKEHDQMSDQENDI